MSEKLKDMCGEEIPRDQIRDYKWQGGEIVYRREIGNYRYVSKLKPQMTDGTKRVRIFEEIKADNQDDASLLIWATILANGGYRIYKPKQPVQEQRVHGKCGCGHSATKAYDMGSTIDNRFFSHYYAPEYPPDHTMIEIDSCGSTIKKGSESSMNTYRVAIVKKVTDLATGKVTTTFVVEPYDVISDNSTQLLIQTGIKHAKVLAETDNYIALYGSQKWDLQAV